MRIVSCTPSTTDILLMLGLGDCIVGADDISMRELPNNDAHALGPVDNMNFISISGLKPDLIIASDSVPGSEAVIDTLRAEGETVMVLHSERLDDLLSDTFSIGMECGVEEKTREVVAALDARLRRICAMVRPTEEPLRAYFEWFPNPFISSGSHNWVSDMMKKAGAFNIFTEFPNPTLVPEEEEIIARDPQVIFICWIGQGDDTADLEREDIIRRKGWGEITAVKEKQIYFLPESLYAYPGPRLLEGLELMIELVAQASSHWS